MKVCAFYVTKKQRVIEEKDVTMVLEQLVKAGASAFVLTQLSPILTNLVGTPITAHASTFDHGVTNGALSEGTDKLLGIANEIISALQKVAEPVAYGFCVKGVLEKISVFPSEQYKSNNRLDSGPSLWRSSTTAPSRSIVRTAHSLWRKNIELWKMASAEGWAACYIAYFDYYRHNMGTDCCS